MPVKTHGIQCEIRSKTISATNLDNQKSRTYSFVKHTQKCGQLLENNSAAERKATHEMPF